jgi:hypothetical protein
MRVESGMIGRSTLLAGWLACLGAAGWSQVVEPYHPAEGAGDEVILPLGTSGAASDLGADAACAGPKPFTRLSRLRWTAPGQPAAARVDFTAFRDGFAKRRFMSTRELPKDTAEIALADLEPGINYYWRVLIRSGGGWIPSQVARFEAPTCPVDFVED